MPPKKRKSTKTNQDEDTTFSPQAVLAKLQEPYPGLDRLMILPPELRERVCSYLHAPGEARWDDKSDLKAIHLTHPEFREIAKVELFRYMVLKFSYEGEWDDQRVWRWHDPDQEIAHRWGGVRESTSDYGYWEGRRIWRWKTPKLIQMFEAEPALRVYVRAIKVQILPDESPERGVVECIPLTSRVESESFLENWENHLLSGAEFAAVNPLFGYVDDSPTAINPDPQFSRRILGVDQHDRFYHLFGRTEDCFNLDDEDLDNSGILDRDVSSRRHPRETFVFPCTCHDKTSPTTLCYEA
jgi:hypothetical protein